MIGIVSMAALAGCTAAPGPVPQDAGQDISREEAILAVRNRPEVVKYEKDLAEAGAVVRIDAQSEDTEWLVQVYEIKDGHTATFNWYRVDKGTGRITTEFP